MSNIPVVQCMGSKERCSSINARIAFPVDKCVKLTRSESSYHDIYFYEKTGQYFVGKNNGTMIEIDGAIGQNLKVEPAFENDIVYKLNSRLGSQINTEVTPAIVGRYKEILSKDMTSDLTDVNSKSVYFDKQVFVPDTISNQYLVDSFKPIEDSTEHNREFILDLFVKELKHIVSEVPDFEVKNANNRYFRGAISISNQ